MFHIPECRLLGTNLHPGVIADLYHPEDTGFQYAVAFCVLSSVGGGEYSAWLFDTGLTDSAPIGTVIGGFVATYHKDPAWIFWVLLIMGGVVQIAHALLVPETRATIILDRVSCKSMILEMALIVRRKLRSVVKMVKTLGVPTS